MDDKVEDKSSLDDSSDQSNASSPLLNEENTYVSEGYACINPLLQSEVNDVSMQRFISKAVDTTHKSLPFPYQTSHLNNYTYLCA